MVFGWKAFSVALLLCAMFLPYRQQQGLRHRTWLLRTPDAREMTRRAPRLFSRPLRNK
jgi:hypothetical protein